MQGWRVFGWLGAQGESSRLCPWQSAVGCSWGSLLGMRRAEPRGLKGTCMVHRGSLAGAGIGALCSFLHYASTGVLRVCFSSRTRRSRS